MIHKGLKPKDLTEFCDLSSLTMAKLSKNEYVSMEVLVRICKALDCTLGEIVSVEQN